MLDGDDLPDGDYESIYGPDALHARMMARLDATRQRQEETMARTLALLARMTGRGRQERERGAGP